MENLFIGLWIIIKNSRQGVYKNVEKKLKKCYFYNHKI